MAGRTFLCALSAALLVAVSGASSISTADTSILHQIVYKEPNERLQELGKISDDDNSLARTYLSPAHRRAAAQLQEWMRDAGMDTWVDAVGNVHGKVNGSDPSAPVLLIGSHYDTVLDGGMYDGALGVVVGISAVKTAVVKRLTQQDRTGEMSVAEGGRVSVSPAAAAGALGRRGVQVVAFADEEGVRFQSTFLGSRALAGTLIKHGMLGSKDKEGRSLEQVLQSEASVADVEAAVSALALGPKDVAEYVEVHIEQGPQLEAGAQSLGVVSAIAGQTRLWVVINGTQGHAGTVPMKGRADSLAAAAHITLMLERRCGGGPSQHGFQMAHESVIKSHKSDMLVCTVGELRVWPGASNVIPGQSQLSLDIRSKSDELRLQVVANVTDSIKELCEARGVSCEIRRNHDAAAVLSDDAVVKGLASAISSSQALFSAAEVPPQASCGVDGSSDSGSQTCGWQQGEVPVLVSGAGHDAMAIAEVTKMGMMFVRCRGGISHSPLEHVEPRDVAASTAALAQYVLDGAGKQ